GSAWIPCYIRNSGAPRGTREWGGTYHADPLLSTENVFLHAEARAVGALRADTISQASLFLEGGNQVVGSAKDRDPNRILITGAAGNLGTMLRPRLRRDDPVLRLADIVEIDPGPGGESVTVKVRE